MLQIKLIMVIKDALCEGSIFFRSLKNLFIFFLYKINFWLSMTHPFQSFLEQYETIVLIFAF